MLREILRNQSTFGNSSSSIERGRLVSRDHPNTAQLNFQVIKKLPDDLVPVDSSEWGDNNR
jgi:hypothetical protein